MNAANSKDPPSAPRFQSFANFGAGLSGIAAIGAVLIGVFAASKADDVLKEVLKVQEQAKGIQTAVQLLSEQVKAAAASRTVEEAQTSKGEPITDPEKIDEILKKRFPVRPMSERAGEATLILPEEAREMIKRTWMRETDPQVRQQVLEQQLKIQNPQ
jgi:hypothetical protein